MNRRCALTDCERKHHAKGYCSKHYRRYLSHGDANKQIIKLDPKTAQAIRADYFGRRATQNQLAARHGVSQCTISKTISGLRWRT